MVAQAVNAVKRAVDLIGSTIGLALTLPAYPLIAAAIKLDSKGPIFYSQTRAGSLRDEAPENDSHASARYDVFRIWKFRTMRTDAEAATGAVLASDQDPRVTRVGRVLRKSRLDELPQLWNVLRGDMSLVGPRPERPELLTTISAAIPYFEERMRGVKPGLTGLAQVALRYSGRPDPKSEVAKLAASLANPFDLPEADGALADDLRIKLLYDLAYSASLERVSSFLRTEVEILLRTPLVMLRASGQ